jgi:tetratricopeptide (TPR) repeat protein
LGSQPEAIGLYRLAIARDPGLAEAYLQLGALLYRRGDVEGALHTLLQEVNYHPPDQRAWHYLGYSYERRFDRKKNPADLRYAGMAYVLALICRPFRPELDMDVIRVRDKMVNI